MEEKQVIARCAAGEAVEPGAEKKMRFRYLKCPWAQAGVTSRSASYGTKWDIEEMGRRSVGLKIPTHTRRTPSSELAVRCRESSLFMSEKFQKKWGPGFHLREEVKK